MSGPFRLAEGGRIDRSRRLAFRFDGRRYHGHPGDTLASALLANGVRLLGRSFKYHRPRGLLAAGPEEPNALVLLEPGPFAEPNLRATEIALYDGLTASERQSLAVARLRSGRGDRTGFGPVRRRLLLQDVHVAAGSWWGRLYAPAIRRMAGLARAPTGPDPEVYEHRHGHCDILVVGGGPAGVAAASAAAAAGARVALADERACFGGALLDGPERAEGEDGAAWAAGKLAGAKALLLPRTTALGYYDHNYVALLERLTDGLAPAARAGRPRARVWHLRARRVVLATGAHERPMPVRRQRPAERHAGRRGRGLHPPPGRDAGSPGGVPRQ